MTNPRRADRPVTRREHRRDYLALFLLFVGVALGAAAAVYAVNQLGFRERDRVQEELCQTLQGYVGQLVPRDERAASLLLKSPTATGRELGRLFASSAEFGRSFATADCDHLPPGLRLPELREPKPRGANTATSSGAQTASQAPSRPPTASTPTSPEIPPRESPSKPDPGGTPTPSTPPIAPPSGVPASPPATVPATPVTPPIVVPPAPPPPDVGVTLPCVRLGPIALLGCS